MEKRLGSRVSRQKGLGSAVSVVASSNISDRTRHIGANCSPVCDTDTSPQRADPLAAWRETEQMARIEWNGNGHGNRPYSGLDGRIGS